MLTGVWVVLQWVDRRFNAELAREQERSRAVAAAKEQQIELLQAELTRLRARNTQLQNQLDEARRRVGGGNT